MDVKVLLLRLLWDEYYQDDVNGNLVAKLVGTVSSGTITNGSMTSYEYDSLNRLTEVDYGYSGNAWPVSTDSYGDISITSADVTYQYSGGSDLKTQMDDGSGTSTYEYDAQGRLTDYTPPLPANYTIHYEYRANASNRAVGLRTK